MKHSIDIASVKRTKKIETTMMEVNDSGRECEFHGDRYIDPFVSFIESLGYEVKLAYPGSSNVYIDGYEFHIHSDNASFMSKNAYTRKKSERKPENRFMGLKRSFSSDGFVVKVPFNKEIETARLKSKIDAAIAARKQRDEEIEAEQATRTNNINYIGNLYASDHIIKYKLDSIYIEKGVITFHFKEKLFYLQINADGSIKEAAFKYEGMKSRKDVSNMVDMCHDMSKIFQSIIWAILSKQALPKEIQEWSMSAYHCCFSVKEMKATKN